MQTDTITLRELTIRYSVKVTPRAIRSSSVANSAPPLIPPHSSRLLQDEPGEVFAILCLSTKHRVIAYHEVSRGSLDSTLVHPREVFKAALLANAAAIVLAHNHPSGDPTPSPDDMTLTRRLVDAGRLLGVDVLDHIVIGDGRHVSFRERGWLA